MPDDLPRKHTLQEATEAPTPAKRARGGDSGPGGQAAEHRRDEEFWYEDGTIALLAGGFEFRVYNGVLASHSPVFADMFSLPQPQTSSTSQSPKLQECPAVSLDDSAEDLRIFLKAILPRDNGTFVRKKPRRPSFAEISAYFRLGHKYQIDHLVNQAVDYLKEHFTDDFDKWTDRDLYVPRGFTEAHAIGVVNIARLAKCDSVLPVALAACSTLELKDLVGGFKRQDGTREKLSEDDILRCPRARETLTREASCAALTAFSALMSLPCRSALCRSGLPQLLRHMSDDKEVLECTIPYRDFDICPDWFEGSTICGPCKKRFQEQLQAAQRLLWTKLPKFLDLHVEGWGAPGEASGRDRDSDSDSDSGSDSD